MAFILCPTCFDPLMNSANADILSKDFNEATQVISGDSNTGL